LTLAGAQKEPDRKQLFQKPSTTTLTSTWTAFLRLITKSAGQIPENVQTASDGRASAHCLMDCLPANLYQNCSRTTIWPLRGFAARVR